MNPLQWQFEWITDWNRIWSEAFVSEWQAWLKASPTAHVFDHPSLVRAWVETYGSLRPLKPRFLVATAHQHTVFLPLVLWTQNWKGAFQRVLVPVADSDFDYHDPVVVGDMGDIDWNRFWSILVQEAQRASWGTVDRMALRGVHGTCLAPDRFVQEADPCPFFDLRGLADSEGLLNALRPSLRGDLRRQQRRMEEIGPVEYKVFGPEEEAQAGIALDDFLGEHSKRWPLAYKAPGFHAALLHRGLETGLVHFSELRIGGQTASWHLGFVGRDRFYYYMPAHREEFAKLSPSKVLMHHCMVDCLQRGIKTFDFLRGNERYKTEWTDQAEPIYALSTDGGQAASRLRNWSADRIRTVLRR